MVSFPSITSDDISKEIKRLDIKETTQECGVFTKYKAASKSHCRLLE